MKKQSTPKAKTRAAIHDAGHAAMALILGAKRSVYAQVWGAGTPAVEALCALAGSVAEAIRYKEREEIEASDLKTALSVASKRALPRFERVASILLRAHWPGVLWLSGELLKRGVVSDSQLKAGFWRAVGKASLSTRG